MSSNIGAWLLETGEPDAVAVRDRERLFTYRELRERVEAVAAHVTAVAADGPRPIVPILGESSFEQLATYLGVLYAGAIAAPLAPMSAAALRSVVAETGARFAFASESTRGSLAELVPQVFELEARPPDATIAPATVDDAEMTLLLFTSGSTGRPRGVMLSPRNLRTNAISILGVLPLTTGDRAFLTLPLYYCYGASVVHTHLRAGASVALSSASFPEVICDELERGDVTGIPAVPSLLELLVERSSLAERDLKRLRYVMVSGGRLHAKAITKLRATLPSVTLHIRYGVTELTAAASFLPPAQLDAKLGSIGPGLPDAPLRVEREDGTEVARGSGEVGEIVATGAHVALGYFGDARPDEGTGFRAGRFHTGDLARVDADGFISIVGRAKEFVKTSGHRVSPAEVEEVLAELPAVLEVAVCGVPHPLRGEALVAGLVLRPGHELSLAEVRTHCAERLPAFKVPLKFVFVASLPRTANGKLSRRMLAETIEL